MAHDVTLPDVLPLEKDGDAETMGLPFVPVMLAYEMSPGTPVTNSVNVAVVVVPRAVTVTVWVVLVCVSVGVPEMVPVRQFMVKPSGSIGETS